MKIKLLILLFIAALASVARADQFQTGHTWSVEPTTAQKFNDTVNKAQALPGLIGEQTAYTGAVDAADELLLRRIGGNALVRVTVRQVQTPTGAVMDFAGGAAPAGWLWCDGREVSRTTYAALFDAIGITFGAGDGSTTFNVPDTRGRVVAGRDVLLNGEYAARLTATGTGNPGIDARNLGAVGGFDRWTLSLAQMPGHSHQTTAFGLATNTGTGDGATRLTGFTSTNTVLGGGLAHPIVQPTLVLTKIIKY